MAFADYVPDPVLDAGHFLKRELAPFPGRSNVMLRCILTSAIVILVSQTLEVPSLALSLLVVFYVTQANVVLTRLVGLMFIVGSTLAIGLSILLLKFTFDYPLIRIIVASVLFFGSVYLLRVLKIGVVFFIVAIVIIYVQTFVDRTDQADLLIRAVLWIWIAVNYPIAVTLVINTLLLPAEPGLQLKAEIHRQLSIVDGQIAHIADGLPAPAPITIGAVQQGAMTLQKLLKFSAMRDPKHVANRAYRLALVATVSRLYRGAGELRALSQTASPVRLDAFRDLRAQCRELDEAVVSGEHYGSQSADRQRGSTASPNAEPIAAPISTLSSAPISAPIAEMQRALQALADFDLRASSGRKPPEEEPMLAADAWTNPAYARFSLKTLLAVLVCYVFYNAADWQGIHTIMLTCVIVALPSLGASTEKAVLRVAGAAIGSVLALLMVVFVIPHLDDIVGLLLMTLPVVAFAAWISAGSERIGYAGIQLAFTFSLALLEDFGPTSNLTEIRDRIVGILLGVGVSTVVQIAFWREGESEVLRVKLSAMLRAVAALLRAPVSEAEPGADTTPGAVELPYSQQLLRAWAVFSDCEAMLARVAIEPGWNEGEQARMTFRAQTVLAQGREIMLAGNALHSALVALQSETGPRANLEMRRLQQHAASEVARYAEDLSANPPVAYRPRQSEVDVTVFADHPDAMAVRDCALELVRQLSGLPDWHVETEGQPALRELYDHD